MKMMVESCADAGSFLESLFRGTGLNLKVAVKESQAECLLDVSGPDSGLLQAEGGELLQALQHLVTQAYGRKLAEGQRLICDVEGFRATREAELRAMALHAAKQVRESGTPFVFGEMNSNERRIIHLTLADSEDLFTESFGEGYGRKVRVSPKRT
jgi:spoIIIJ-associated protein